MNSPKCLTTAKLIAICGFLVLLSSTYFLRTEVLKLNSIRFSADEARAKYQLQQVEEDYPYELERFKAQKEHQEAKFKRDRERYKVSAKNYETTLTKNTARYEVAQKNYTLQEKHYAKMLEMYLTDYDAYVKAIKDKYRPPQLPDEPSMPKLPSEPTQPQMPVKPQPPRSPEYTKQLSEIDATFRTQKHHYFAVTSVMNWFAMVGAMCLVSGLLYLILFDTADGRLLYFMTLVLSFVFLIGPSFHSIMSAIVGFLAAPGVY